MALIWTPNTDIPEANGIVKLGNAYLLCGTLTATGSYATGGDTFSTNLGPVDFLKKAGGLGKVLKVHVGGGWGTFYDAANAKLKLYVSGGTEVSAAAYNALLVSGVKATVLGR